MSQPDVHGVESGKPSLPCESLALHGPLRT